MNFFSTQNITSKSKSTSEHIWLSGKFEKLETNSLRRETSVADLCQAESPKSARRLRRVKSDTNLASLTLALEWPMVYRKGEQLGEGAYAQVSQVDLSSPPSLSEVNLLDEDGSESFGSSPEIIVGSPSQRRLWESEMTPRRHSSFISGRTPRTPSPRSMAFKQFRRNPDDPIEDLDFSLEVQILASLNHSQIPKVYQTFSDGFFIELIKGPTLDQYLGRFKGKRLSELEARPILRQLVNLVSYIHENGVVHRDLKPENIKVTGSDGVGNDVRLHLIDFGFSSFFHKTMDDEDKMLIDRCGTMEYMSMELMNSDPYYGPEADIWSLGCLIYEIVQGKPPFYGSMSKIYQGICEHLRNPDSALEYPQPVSKLFKSLVRSCLSPLGSDRRSITAVVDNSWWTASINDLKPEIPKPIVRKPRKGLRVILEEPISVN